MKIGLQAYIQGTVEAVEFYQKAFGGTLGYNVRNDDGTFMHAEINLDGQLLIALSEASTSVGLENIKRYSPTDYPTMNFSVSLGSEDAVKKAYEVLIEGGNILLPIGPLPWNTCCANVIDKFGIFWYVSV
ncbi:VOC family protein [Clostridium manihotivorum]|uniref:VOC family protein n=1 Tax=Clostridium manihotivorum TaxID=2320868 RepID=A0A3R5UFC2_9CLOT|nr:VOC family protein [Clostridium manihotivorum]QAA32218.1 VOC family protein [Clostridium manihotivorum]